MRPTPDSDTGGGERVWKTTVDGVCKSLMTLEAVRSGQSGYQKEKMARELPPRKYILVINLFINQFSNLV